MRKYVDVTARDTERQGDILARLLIEEPQQDHRPLDFAQLCDANAQTHFGAGKVAPKVLQLV